MNFKRLPIFGVAALFFSVAPVRAEVMYRCVDADGRKVFSNVKSNAPGMKCTAVQMSDPAPPRNQSAARTPTPPNFPKVDGSAQRTRDAERRRILESEKESEQKSLAQAQKDLEEQEAMRGGNEKNYQRVLDRLQPYKDKVASHERNLEAIEKEISNLR
ncbi:MAG: DUF4124 domain-containing protein [Candidatus Accumulibacter sp.]|jgi:hypothetical protein|nr:DUF4124 domain-containing protein [Accumulibacter sp.]